MYGSRSKKQEARSKFSIGSLDDTVVEIGPERGEGALLLFVVVRNVFQ